MFKEALIFIGLILALVEAVHADVPAQNCQDLSQIILRKYGVVEETLKVNAGKLTKTQQKEVNELLSTACSPKFADCGYSYCKKSNAAETSPVSSVSSSDNSVSSEATAPLTTQLDWVTENMSCEDFLGQLRIRFQTKNLDPNKRQELKTSLDLACGERFKHCNFEACRGRTD